MPAALGVTGGKGDGAGGSGPESCADAVPGRSGTAKRLKARNQWSGWDAVTCANHPALHSVG